jgi:hypothetical protein
MILMRKQILEPTDTEGQKDSNENVCGEQIEKQNSVQNRSQNPTTSLMRQLLEGTEILPTPVCQSL